MTKFLPIFPLNLVVYPGQDLNLHIFEPRYRQLINECHTTGKTFGIPPVINEQITEFGTEMQLVKVAKVYAGGEMDITTRGVRVFRIMEVLKDVPGKLYPAAVVYEFPHVANDTGVLNPTLIDLVDKLHGLLGTKFSLFDKFKNPLSYDIAPYIALSTEDQCRLLAATSEKGRQWFMIEHLQRLIPTLEDTEKVKAKISLNGHFRNEIPPSF